MDTMDKSKFDDVNTFETISDDRVAGFEGLNEQETRALEKRLVRKVDIHLISALFLIFIFNILDRSNIANAKLGGIAKDLKLTGTQYQTAVSIMFVGYLLGQIPSNIILTRVKPSRYIPCAIFLWGGISLATAGVKNFTGLMVIRILLGLAESPFFPGALLLISSWYKPIEIAPRVAVVYCGNTIANGFGGMLAAGILGGLHKANGLEGWRWLYIIEGAGTILAGLLAFFLLPDFPNSGQQKWLTEQEQRFAIWRLAEAANHEEDENGTVKQGLKDAFTDPKTWILVFMQVCLLTSQTWTYFFPSIVKTLGYNTIITLLITAPVYVFGFIVSLSNAFVAMRTSRLAVLIMWPAMLDIVGNIMVIKGHTTPVRYTGMFFMCAGSFAAFNVIQAWIASTIPRTRTKRAIVYAFVNLMGNTANIYGAYFFPDSDAPQYEQGGIILSSFAAAEICTAAFLAYILYRLNKKAEKEEESDGQPRYRYLW
ncbi:putative pantothenate transporter [Cucurbitaria berberidis CBS 394.84]|uniref:Pantothenate transporter n=1 Tax=Cucurbitaria berberidis CBS 394.84 TaxID=1168544 RepID=A0A9P4GIF8_9PLEO|nr:putative pantothenate transporter [Cucurbitaria berberidis CBS 394.84]KAF1846059.1 putative pantothenate transporter [Cucurbitaria berberidis CBS 394.84]